MPTWPSSIHSRSAAPSRVSSICSVVNAPGFSSSGKLSGNVQRRAASPPVGSEYTVRDVLAPLGVSSVSTTSTTDASALEVRVADVAGVTDSRCQRDLPSGATRSSDARSVSFTWLSRTFLYGSSAPTDADPTAQSVNSVNMICRMRTSSVTSTAFTLLVVRWQASSAASHERRVLVIFSREVKRRRTSDAARTAFGLPARLAEQPPHIPGATCPV
jgi:hypothetical protein